MNSEDLSGLAALYAINTLDEAEQSWVESQFDHLSEFQAEVAEVESVAAMLAYGVDLLPMDATLKDRLFQRIAAGDEAQDEAPSHSIASLLEQTKVAQWEPYLPTPGVELARLRIDSNTRQVDCFVRSFGQTKFPEHRHAETEEIVVLDGDLVIGDQIYSMGDRIYSQPGTVHQPETLSGCTIFIRTSLDDEILS